MRTDQRVLITGINGFTGKYLAENLLRAGYVVFGTGTEAIDKIDNSLGYYSVDLRDLASIKKVVKEVRPDFVVHLAALAFVGHGDANDFYEVNLVGTRNLLSALTENNISPTRVLLASSANVYGNAQAGVLNERALVSPANDYAVSKLAMEYVANLWRDRLPIVIVRPFNYTGVGQDEKFLIPKIVRHFREKSSLIELGNIDVWRDFSDVRAVVDAYQGLLEVDCNDMTVNVCSGVTFSLREILTMCQNISGHSLDIQINPAFVRANEVKSLCGDEGLLRTLVPDWSSRPLKDTLSWMLNS
tara:strand:+ start:18008 stop:18910 length:903 start_codon:yes stop_codon:yes gene_type:complete